MTITITKKNIRRTGIPATKNGLPIAGPETATDGVPTKERMRIAGEENISVGGDERTGKRYVFRDSPLDRALGKKLITGAQHSALQKYRHHWYHAGQCPNIGSVDLNRVFASDGGSVAGMPVSEAQVFHRQRWREAMTEIGLRASTVVTRFACEDKNLEECGAAIGWGNKAQAISAATEIVKSASDRLSRLWGIG